MTHRLNDSLIPTTDIDAYAMMHELLRDAATELRDIATAPARRDTDFPFDFNPRDEIRDHDDYISAAASLCSMMIDAMIDMTSPLDALRALLADTDFLDTCLTADFDSPLLHLIDFDY